MASAFDQSYMNNILKLEHILAKLQDCSTKPEKFSHFESLNSTVTRCTDFHKALENGVKSSTFKSKSRLGAQTRGESQACEVKSTLQKPQPEFSFPATSKIPFLPLLSIRTNALEELFKELKDLKNAISEIEEKNKINTQCIQVNKAKIASLEECQEKLKKKAGMGLSYEQRKEELQSRLKELMVEWKQSTGLLRKSLQELEQQARMMTSKEDVVRNQIARQGADLRVQRSGVKERSLGDSRSYEGLMMNQSRVLFHSPSVNTVLL